MLKALVKRIPVAYVYTQLNAPVSPCLHGTLYNMLYDAMKRANKDPLNTMSCVKQRRDVIDEELVSAAAGSR